MRSQIVNLELNATTSGFKDLYPFPSISAIWDHQSHNIFWRAVTNSLPIPRGFGVNDPIDQQIWWVRVRYMVCCHLVMDVKSCSITHCFNNSAWRRPISKPDDLLVVLGSWFTWIWTYRFRGFGRPSIAVEVEVGGRNLKRVEPSGENHGKLEVITTVRSKNM